MDIIKSSKDLVPGELYKITNKSHLHTTHVYYHVSNFKDIKINDRVYFVFYIGFNYIPNVLDLKTKGHIFLYKNTLICCSYYNAIFSIKETSIEKLS